MAQAQASARGRTVDDEEVARFEAMAQTWWDPDGPMRVLHRFNPVRLAYLRDALCVRFDRDPASAFPLEGLTIVDVGCGGGVLSIPLARLGARMLGLDPAGGNIAVARREAERQELAIEFREEAIEDVVARGERFDAVLAMEVVEHVADVDAFVGACATGVREGGLLAMATINRTPKSFALAIVGAEYVLRWLPRGTHSWRKFVTPDELALAIERHGLTVIDEAGVVYEPLKDMWRRSRDTDVNYMMLAERP